MDRCKNVKERKIYVIAHVTLKSQIMYTVVPLRHVADIYHPDKEKRDYNRQSSRNFETELTKLKQTKNKKRVCTDYGMRQVLTCHID